MTKKNLNFEDSLAKLESIVDALEDTTLAWKRVLKNLKKGLSL